ncbi:MAG: thiamine pyrophosphate-dependent dehydrogenase E1 component subunit alpha [Kiritimatiellia bacterium]
MDLLTCHAHMLTIRFFEEAVERLFHEGRIGGTAHTCIGQEAVAVGVAAALQPGDAVTSTHRGHGHFLALGADPGRLMAELFGRATGYSGGRGGSQMMMDISRGFYGANGITGGSIPFAAGLALDARLRGTERVVVCFFGDGASNQGVFHETLNLAALWKLPVVFLCENNGYAMSTSVKRGLARPHVADRAASYSIPSAQADGNDLLAVQQAVMEALQHARSGKGPVLLECRTYRLSGHSRGDKREYRHANEESEAWLREPIRHFEAFLKAQKQLPDDAAVSACHAEAQARIAAAIRFAEESPLPDVKAVAEGVYA